MDKPIILAICGPAASGKDTLAETLLHFLSKNSIKSHMIIADTTRPQRANEICGKDYYFKTKSDFIQNIRDHKYIEYTDFRGWYYGTNIDAIHNDSINIGVFNLQSIANLYRLNNYDIIPIYLDTPFGVRMKRYYKRAGHFTWEQIRRAITDYRDFSKGTIFLSYAFPTQYLVLKSTENSINCAKILQHLHQIFPSALKNKVKIIK